uniref:Serine aminopeptidase S33 domain-containing protein n=1 Tax=Pyramimonas obovata TaxID=1411642 RepID=A0A7S0MVE6_9CHLO|mmetsp:Transcript_14461/g.30939  ORF Transcript_14461/g.30939 Transcript_14461/m.30939 type:complete len:325 (+) Transcript_14461:65-1039(+)
MQPWHYARAERPSVVLTNARKMTSTSGNPSQSGFFEGSGKFKLYYQTWLPQQQSAPRGHVLYYTGLHESLDITGVDRLSKSLTDQGYAFHGYEHQGHGRSSGKKGYVKSLKLLEQHALEFIDFILKSYTGSAPFFMIGHSMGGGLLALLGDRVIEQYGPRFGGAILLSAALAGPNIGGPVICMLRVVACMWPSAPLGPPEDPYAGFATREEADRYKNSPHNYTGNMRLKTGQVFLDELFPAVARGLESGELKSAFPYYAIHAKEDALPVSAVKDMMAVSKSGDNELREVRGHSHQLLADPGWESILEGIVAWIETRTDRQRNAI